MGFFKPKRQEVMATTPDTLDRIWELATTPDRRAHEEAAHLLRTLANHDEQAAQILLSSYVDSRGLDASKLWTLEQPEPTGLLLPRDTDLARDWDKIARSFAQFTDAPIGHLRWTGERWTVIPLEATLIDLSGNARPTEGETYSDLLRRRNRMLMRFNTHRQIALTAPYDAVTDPVRRTVAQFFGVRPWEIDVVVAMKDGHVEHVIVSRVPPMGSEEKRRNLARELIKALPRGSSGWKIVDNPITHRMVLSYGEPLHLPDLHPADFARLLDPARQWVLPYGVDAMGREIAWEVQDDPMAMVVGRTGTGKTLAIYPIIAAALSRGWELAVCEVSKGGGDYEEIRAWVRESGWGCDSKSDASTVIQSVYAMKDARMKVINGAGHKKIHSMTRAEQETAGLKPILLVIDEAAALLAAPPTIKGLPKDHPKAVEVAQEQTDVALAGDAIRRISAELRAVGVHLLFATQRYDASLFGPAGGGLLRAQLGHRLVLGTMSTTTLGMSVENPETAGFAYATAHGVALTNDPSADLAKPRPGRGIVETGTQTRPVQVAYAPMEDWIEALEARHLPKPGGSAPRDGLVQEEPDQRPTVFNPFDDPSPDVFDDSEHQTIVDEGFSLDDYSAPETAAPDLSHLVVGTEQTTPPADELWD